MFKKFGCLFLVGSAFAGLKEVTSMLDENMTDKSFNSLAKGWFSERTDYEQKNLVGHWYASGLRVMPLVLADQIKQSGEVTKDLLLAKFTEAVKGYVEDLRGLDHFKTSMSKKVSEEYLTIIDAVIKLISDEISNGKFLDKYNKDKTSLQHLTIRAMFTSEGVVYDQSGIAIDEVKNYKDLMEGMKGALSTRKNMSNAALTMTTDQLTKPTEATAIVVQPKVKTGCHFGWPFCKKTDVKTDKAPATTAAPAATPATAPASSVPVTVATSGDTAKPVSHPE